MTLKWTVHIPQAMQQHGGRAKLLPQTGRDTEETAVGVEVEELPVFRTDVQDQVAGLSAR